MSRGARRLKLAPSTVGLAPAERPTLVPPANPPGREWLWHRAQLAWARIDDGQLEAVVSWMESLAERGCHQ